MTVPTIPPADAPTDLATSVVLVATSVEGHPDLRGLWLAIAILTALIVALIAGGLSYVDDRRVPAAVIRGGVAFGATIGCLLGIYAFLS